MTATPASASNATILPVRAGAMIRLRRTAEAIVIPLFALLVSAALFSLFLLALGKDPVEFFSLVWRGGFGTAFSWQNTLVRATPLILAGLCVAIPARIGLVIVGGEGALVLGGFCAAAAALPFIGWAPRGLLLGVMLLAALASAALWIGLVGALRHNRGVNETISSLLLTYIAVAIMSFFIEGMLRDPADPNRPSTKSIGAENMIGPMPGLDVHWGFGVAVVLAIVLGLVMSRTTYGFALRVAGGNARAALAQGLPVGKLMISACLIAGACAGLAGFFEVAAIHGKANASLRAGYGFTGILVAFLARHNPFAIPLVALMFGGIAAAGGLIQRRLDVPDATVLVLQGLVFIVLLASEPLYGRLRLFNPKIEADRT